MRWTPNYHVACQIQKKILAQMEGPLEPNQLASLSKAWDTLEERKRILRMKPLPKAQDVSAVREKARVRAIPRE